MIDQYKHKQLQIGLVSPQQIKAWAKKILPNGEVVGEVTRPSTFHYKTDKPEKDGLFCERIFGPIKSGICACGNSRASVAENEDERFCQKCGVEFVDSRIRRYQMGYIKLACPVTHVWYLKGLPSYIANLLDKPLKKLEGLVYGDFSFARPSAKKPTFLRLRGLFEDEISSCNHSISPFFSTPGFATFRNREIATGAGAIREQLADLDLRIIIENSLVEWKELEDEGYSGDEWEDRKRRIRKVFLIRRMQLAKHFIQTNVEPEWMVLCLLPVLPPELRPIVYRSGDKVVTSDINELYKRVIRRNNNLAYLLKRSELAPADLVMCQEKLVQEAVDTLLDSGSRGQPMRDGHNKVYKSLSDVIEGKEGRFRETLLGKRVDYSGRSVIVVGPSLSLHQCGLPLEIAIKLFQLFVIRDLITKRATSNVRIAKRKIWEKEPIVWEILQEVMRGHPVLLNRAPTLHRLGIQAFQPTLVEGRTICLHPLVCKGFNADFDGDQMAVHLPLSLEAQAEARLLMFSHMNLLSPAIGDPICVPTQDMLIGLYVLTIGNRRGICANRYNSCGNSPNKKINYNNNNYYKYTKDKEPHFSSSYDALGAYRQKRIGLNSPLWLRWKLDQRIVGSREVPIEVQYESFGTYHEIYAHYLVVGNRKKEIRSIYIRTTLGHISFYREIEEAIQGFSRAYSYTI
ncbi:RNA polymerase beta subunit (chloroplast) [Sorghum bicolor]|uniref:DNA-directed RNA polymerase subunit beta' n=59 Tax=Andropogoneae TaxID=147429 RepID=RPOC1_SORBI|nr:RNA polymerase beta [Pogonatherum paniceum]YP_009260060.1 RNA polymerase beta [Imperata cylindrica]YP_009268133.1 RNA polymerase beta [Hyparrhenia subplumosa]YP_009370970.1 RNA polymerase beta [Saccharum spontaneum]YP_009384887.1 RNA polymerase beta [Dimeria ornithopoda]YP_009385053.1 RNA polymerase beta [Sorghum mekongense]YP_009385302.1 RNA polymerase beta [Heteropogon triticeus]YP_009386049.1 RNA polymerase beta [Chrysopogon zizanioides]YP_009386132.1 RNA polymerase beta [Chrysopogon |eukprot:YP_899398.1 RNA polymerase beta subunit (chloroplast) [Sorghum bicolor]